jgi:nuclear transport factor 2 (NTF2) superfamily protein
MMKPENQRHESLLPLWLFVKKDELDFNLSGLAKLRSGCLSATPIQANQNNYKWASSAGISRTSEESVKQRNPAS